ncbi:UvrD-helicase domain-containing protein [bacterium]|nr:UvrD-helicase domain-containing protein [candidate division CSSED10-310 bacterium]
MILNHQQEIAVKHKDGPILVLAGAGSGKTRVIVNRINHLICFAGVPAWQILAITFTNKAANEMKERIHSMAGPEVRLTIGTFHSICAKILRVEHQHLQVHANFTIADEADQVARIKKAMAESGVNPDKITGKQLITAISKAKNRFESPSSMKENASGNPFLQTVADVYEIYERGLRADHALDFDDLIIKSVMLFRQEPAILEKYQNRYRYIMIDEYQDTNSAQYEWVQLLGQRYRNIMAVGDDDQSIYRWRGAEVSNILNFARDFPGAKVIKLEQNYRSTQVILSAASALMSHNIHRNPKNLWTEQKDGDLIIRTIWPTDRSEAEAVGRQITSLVEKKGRKFGEMAIFYRINAQSRLLEEIMHSFQIPYRVVGNISFFKRKEVKDLLAYMRLVLNPFDSGACRRIINVPRRGIGKTTIEILEKEALKRNLDLFSTIESISDSGLLTDNKLKNILKFHELILDLIHFERTHRANEFIDYMIDVTGYREMFESEMSTEARTSLEIIEEFENTVAEFSDREESRLADFADYLSLYSESDDDQTEQKRDLVQLMTLHNAKGLEFPVVFITGIEENLCPLIRSDTSLDPAEIEEERRLLYVGMTRAMEKLFLFAARQRFLYGRPIQQQASRFLAEIPDKCIEDQSMTMERNFKSPVTELSLRSDYKTGDRIRHPSWGLGTVLHCIGSGPQARLTIRFDRFGPKKILAGPANLTRMH